MTARTPDLSERISVISRHSLQASWGHRGRGGGDDVSGVETPVVLIKQGNGSRWGTSPAS